MSNWYILGSELKKFRKKADMTQGKLIDQFSIFVSQLSEQECKKLNSIALDQEIETYFGGILDTPTLSKIERGKRILSSRKRVLAFIWGFKKIGVLTTIEEAEQLLELGEYGSLTQNESAALFNSLPPLTHENNPINTDFVHPLKASLLPTESPQDATVYPSEIKQPHHNTRPLPMMMMGLLVALCLSGVIYLQFFGRDKLPPPSITEDFSDTLDATLWSMEQAPNSSLENERLLFDSPVHDDPEWLSEGVQYLGEKQPISRIKFEISVDTPETYTPGSLGLLTNCLDGKGWMNVYAGQKPPRLFVEYAKTSEITDWHEDVKFVDILNPIERGKIYAIDLHWVDDSLHVSVEEDGVDTVIIPCNWTSYFYIHTSLSQGEKIRGFIDQLQVWHD